jgi:hypothetical protein
LTQLNRSQACLLIQNQETYFYLIEDLGINACIQVIHPKEFWSTHHWRITIKPLLKLVDEKEEQKETLDTDQYLQIRFATLAPYQVCENMKAIVIQPGIMSWRS